MGQWSDGVWEGSYSSKLPFGPIRKLAGDSSTNEFYFNTRTTIDPDQALLEATPIGEWVHDALAAVEEASFASSGSDHRTALQVLRFFVQLNKIFLQDAAAMIVLHPERDAHPLFNLRVFKTDEFKAYAGLMKQAIQNESDPVDANLESVLPRVFWWHNAQHSATTTLSSQVVQLSKDLKSGLLEIHQHNAKQREESDRPLAASFIQVASELIKGGSSAIVGLGELYQKE